MDGACDSGPQGSVEVVYSEVVPIYIQNKDKDERQRKLRVTIERMTGLSQVCPQVLGLNLKDDEDPFFIYSTRITEDDFKCLKTQQGLLVDFENFVEHLVRLVDQCTDSAEQKFLVVLNRDGTETCGMKNTTLQFIQRTKFKNLCHLLLDVIDASDEEIKKNMASTIKKLKEELQSSVKQVADLQCCLADATKKLEMKTEACDKIYGKCMEEKDNIQMKLTQQLIVAKEEFSKAQMEWQKSGELEKQCIVDKYEDIVKHMENQLSSFKSQVKTSHESISQLEYKNRVLKSLLESTEKEKQTLIKEATALKRQNSQLDEDYHEKERGLQDLRTRFAVLEQEVRDKAEMLDRKQKDYTTLSYQKKSAEATLFEKEMYIQRQADTLKNVTADLIKTNEILKLQQIELNAVKDKLQLSTNVAFEQEKVLQSKSKRITELMEHNNQIKDSSSNRIQELEQEINILKKTLFEVETNLQEKDKKIRINEDVIERLNRRVSEAYASNPWVLRRPHGLDTRFSTAPMNNDSLNMLHGTPRPIPARVARGTRSYYNVMQYHNRGQPPTGHFESTGSTNSGCVASGGDRDAHVSHPPANEMGTEVSAVPSSAGSKQTVTSEMNNVEQRLPNTKKKVLPGGILRKPIGQARPLSAYFNNAEGK